ncbi:hypothetical protein ACS0PU_005503 [Formica fusca]
MRDGKFRMLKAPPYRCCPFLQEKRNDKGGEAGGKLASQRTCRRRCLATEACGRGTPVDFRARLPAPSANLPATSILCYNRSRRKNRADDDDAAYVCVDVATWRHFSRPGFLKSRVLRKD